MTGQRLPWVEKENDNKQAFEIRSGYSHTLGANYDGEGVNFAIFSAHAERVELCLYDPSGEHEIARLELPEYTDEIWHGYVPKLQPGALYGYRVYGPYDPENGHRFNPNKLLIDPYAVSWWAIFSGTMRISRINYFMTIKI